MSELLESPEQQAETAASYTPSDELCWCFEPLPSQKQFGSLTDRFKGFSGPVGSGKSAALCFEAIRAAYVNRGRYGLLAAPTLAMLRDATLASLFAMLDQFEVPYELHKSDGELRFVATGSVTLLRSLDEPERLRGTNLAWFGVDELSYSEEDGWLRLEARLRDPRAARLVGFAVWTPKGFDWVYKRFIRDRVNGYGCVQARPFENKFLLANTPDYYKRLEDSYDPRFYQQEVLGDYLNNRADRVYHCFNAAVHVIKHKYNPEQPLLWALDFNVAPMSSVLAQVASCGRLAVIDEIVLERGTTADACEEFVLRYGQHKGELEIFGDASGHSGKTAGATDFGTLRDLLTRDGFKRARFRVQSRNPSVTSRVQMVNAMLMTATGEVRMEVDPRCKHLIRDFEEVLYKPDSGVIDKDRDPKRTHTSDALGYLIWQLRGPKPVAGEMNKPVL